MKEKRETREQRGPVLKMVRTNEMVRPVPKMGDRTPAMENDPYGPMRTNFSKYEIEKNAELRAMLKSGKTYASSDYMVTRQKQKMGVDYFAASDTKRSDRDAVSMQLATRNFTYEGLGSNKLNMHTVSNPEIFRSGMQIEEDIARRQSLRKTVSDRDAMRKQVQAVKTAYLPM